MSTGNAGGAGKVEGAAGFTDGSELGTIDARFTAIGVVLHSPRAVGGIVLSLAVTVVSLVVAVASDDGGVEALASLGGVAGLLALVLVPGFVFTYAPAAYYSRLLASRFPGARILSSQNGIPLHDAVGELLRTAPAGREPSTARLTTYFVLGPDGFSLWNRSDTTLRSFLAVPRSRVIGITNGLSDPRVSAPGPFAAIHLRKDDGTSYDLYASFTPPRFSGPMKLAIWQETIVKWLTTQYLHR